MNLAAAAKELVDLERKVPVLCGSSTCMARIEDSSLWSRSAPRQCLPSQVWYDYMKMESRRGVNTDFRRIYHAFLRYWADIHGTTSQPPIDMSS